MNDDKEDRLVNGSHPADLEKALPSRLRIIYNDQTLYDGEVKELMVQHRQPEGHQRSGLDLPTGTPLPDDLGPVATAVPAVPVTEQGLSPVWEPPQNADLVIYAVSFPNAVEETQP